MKRDDELLYLSTFLLNRDQIIKAWGNDGLAHCDPITGSAPGRIETVLKRGSR